jgi:hypothetical protein
VSTIRVAKRDKFTIIDRRSIADEDLSFRALGILVWLLDKPDDWKIDAERMCAQRKEGRDAIRTACKELVDAGYMVRERKQGPGGRWTTTITVYETPRRTEDGFPGVGNPTVGEPGAKTNTETDNSLLAQLPLSVPDFFDEFWTAWPKKVGKRAAHLAFKRATARSAPMEIIRGAERMAEQWRRMEPADRQYVPYPERWLNGDRWLDEMPSQFDAPTTARVEWVADANCPECAGTGWSTLEEGGNTVGPCPCRSNP